MTMTTSAVRKITPVLLVEEIESCLPFWVDRLGFRKTAEVPEGGSGRLGFVILEKDGVEVMYQTRKSVSDDLGTLGEVRAGQAFLFIEVADVDAVERAMDGVRQLIPRRRTFYGMDEVVVREPGGSVVIFAQPVNA